MVVLNKKAFVLPRFERDKFIRLMRLGLEYDRARGTFSISKFDNIEEVLDTISSILNEEALFLQNCMICNKDFACSECKYIDFCETKNLPFQCVCPQCLKKGKSPQQKLF
ncbi:MAG: hypothetical protein CW716_01075 [Candidatus Bathyarchaeum sp.]|nr:MAG: hypothetical protein CW716_01075 [Candidatus Bathyarchaeum sp.]